MLCTIVLHLKVLISQPIPDLPAAGGGSRYPRVQNRVSAVRLYPLRPQSQSGNPKVKVGK